MSEVSKNHTKKIDQLKHRFLMKTYLIKKNKEKFASAFMTENENMTISQSQADDKRTFVFVAVKMMNDSIKMKNKINKMNSFFERFIISTN